MLLQKRKKYIVEKPQRMPLRLSWLQSKEWTQFVEEASGGREAIYNVIIDDGVPHEINGVLFNFSLLDPFQTVSSHRPQNVSLFHLHVQPAGVLLSEV